MRRSMNITNMISQFHIIQVPEETDEEIVETEDDHMEEESIDLGVPSQLLTGDLLQTIKGPIEIIISSKCSICDNLHGGLTKCFICDTFCHTTSPCSQVENGITTCQLCLKSANMANERNMAVRQQQKQAQKMLSETAKRFKPAELGDNVVVPIPEVDRGRTDFRNLPGVITSVGGDGTYTIGTQQGVLKQSYVRSQFIPTNTPLIAATDVPTKQVSLREAAQSESLAHGQGFQRCSCRGGCKSNICSCKRNGKLCNSKCHKSLTCNNK